MLRRRPGGLPYPKRLNAAPATPRSSSPLGRFVTNANAPQFVDPVHITGYAKLSTLAVLAVSGVVGSAQYQFGTHAQAIHNAEAAKSQVFSSAATPPATPSALGTQIVTRQELTEQPRSNVFASARAPAVATGVLGKFVYAPEQSQDLSPRSDIAQTATNPQGYLMPVLSGDENTYVVVPSRIFASAVTPPVTSGKLGAFIVAPESVYDRSLPSVLNQPWHGPQGAVPPLTYAAEQLLDRTQQAFVSPVPKAAPGIVSTFVYTAEQVIDRTIQPVLNQPWHGPQGNPPPLTYAGEQFLDRTQPAVIFQPSLTPPPIAGPTVFPMPPVPPQIDYDINRSVVWTWTPLSVAGTPPPPSTVVHQIPFLATIGRLMGKP